MSRHDDPKPDAEFYFEDIYIVVEDSIFKVPKRNFEDSDSEVFSGLFRIPPIDGVPEGLSSTNPLKLESIRREDFCAFLRAMFPRNPCAEAALSESEWISVLRLASLWGFSTLKQTAIAKLADILDTNPVQALALANDLRNGVEEWLAPAITALARRDRPISRAEIDTLGIDLALKVMHVRERAFEGVPRVGEIWDARTRSLIPAKRATWDFAEDIEAVFGLS